eukprot:TRINITY_DN107177_c0_g1_i1.p1 TRINITY_DN107177_c0_g1~~TRINITY_DN107177_c0_g1_i1.p1  ORF type:complete len:378 (-),score=86.09 TRINITY_DN107177_c0_g1_i1:90-1223(-)
MDDDDEPRRFLGPSKDLGASMTDGHPPPRLGDPLSAADAEALMAVVGPDELPEAWKQGFFFAGYQPYGLQQVQGGSCGVIATVQAFVIRSLLERSPTAASLLEVDEKLRQEALLDAIAEVLFRIVGDNKKAVVMVPSSASAAVLNKSQLRCLQPAMFTSYDQFRYHLTQRPYRDLFFNPSGCGVPLFLYSMVWTRGIENLRERDFDDPKTGSMIGGHGYCTQELVNLMIFGRAYCNVFDGSKRLGSAKDGWCVLQGAPRRPTIGFLSLFEAYKCIEVGSRYKGPTCPIWIVCAESHYTVLFSPDVSVDGQDSSKAIDLYYFDQLARQSERIRLTVIPKQLPGHLTTGFEETESMIDRCIRTKWKDAAVDWNGSEVIL